MVDTDDDTANAVFHALADSTRRDILRRVLIAEHSITELASAYSMSMAAVQKHIAALGRADLLTKRKVGRKQLAYGNLDRLRAASTLLAELETARFEDSYETLDEDTAAPAADSTELHEGLGGDTDANEPLNREGSTTR